MIDTAEKRRSAAGVPFLPLGVGLTPNFSKDLEWRQQAAWGYSGISVGIDPSTLFGWLEYTAAGRQWFDAQGQATYDANGQANDYEALGQASYQATGGANYSARETDG